MHATYCFSITACEAPDPWLGTQGFKSIFYGSFRYWLYFLIIPDPIIKIIELDAKQILWASDPTLLSNEEGTSKRARRWIHEMASYLPWSKGGAGILHWESHCKAFYASWIVRFLDPRRSPWKDVCVCVALSLGVSFGSYCHG